MGIGGKGEFEMLKFIHAADFHLDSAFAALPPEKAAERRREQRELPGRLAEAVRTWGAELALLAGDLFDGKPYPETVEAVKAALAEMAVPVFLAPGNHDFYGPDSPYAGDWPENVHIFRTGRMESVPLPELGVTVHGAAFLGPTQEEGLLRDFTAAEDGMVHLGVLHGELGEASVYDPVSREDIAASGLAYLALGHVHKRTEPLRFGDTTAAWPGCPEGRGFDELGEKGFYAGVLQDGQVTLRFVSLGKRRYWVLPVDVTGRDAAEAVEAALSAGAEGDLCRVLLRGESSGASRGAALIWRSGTRPRCPRTSGGGRRRIPSGGSSSGSSGASWRRRRRRRSGRPSARRPASVSRPWRAGTWAESLPPRGGSRSKGGQTYETYPAHRHRRHHRLGADGERPDAGAQHGAAFEPSACHLRHLRCGLRAAAEPGQHQHAAGALAGYGGLRPG